MKYKIEYRMIFIVSYVFAFLLWSMNKCQHLAYEDKIKDLNTRIEKLEIKDWKVVK
jgi:hypothetical protein